jgi:hypothetical protein
MNDLPIGVNGIPSGWEVRDDFTISECTNLSIVADDVIGNSINTTLHLTITVNGIDSLGNLIEGLVISQTTISDSFE